MNDKFPATFRSLLKDKLVVLALPDHQFVKDFVKENRPRDVLILSNQQDTIEMFLGKSTPFTHVRQLTSNNCSALILHGRSIFALAKKRYFQRSQVESLFLKRGLVTKLMRWQIKRYERKKILTSLGTVVLDARNDRYDVYRVAPLASNNRHAFYDATWTPIEALKALSSLNYCLMRSVNAVEQGLPFKDLDLLVADNHVSRLHEIFSGSVGTVAVDVYSESGVAGHDFGSVPYFKPKFATRALQFAQTRTSGIKCFNNKYQYLTLAYHSLFHAKSAHLPADWEELNSDTFKKKGFYETLCASASEAGFPIPLSLSDLEQALREHKAFPSHDLLAFYARRNQFVAKRYVESVSAPEGLMTLFVRDFEQSSDHLEIVRSALQEKNSIVFEVALSDRLQEKVIEHVRGGNWFDKEKGAPALPIHAFVCVDSKPELPTGKIARKFPNLDNRNIQRLKRNLRLRFGDTTGVEKRVVHSSDNTVEALEHIREMGLLNNADIKQRLIELGFLNQEIG